MAHLLVFGASGISGWAVMRQALSYPTPTKFRRITGTTRRPRGLDQLHLPCDDERLSVVGGIDLTLPVQVVKKRLEENISSIADVTHVIYTGRWPAGRRGSRDTKIHGMASIAHFGDTAYTVPADSSPMALRAANDAMLDTAIKATSSLAPRLESVVLQTGGKAYGLLFWEHVKLDPPFHESQPRVPSPWGDEIFYYSQHDTLARLSKEANQRWTFTEIRPDVIIGFAPGDGNYMNLAHGLAFYLSLYREVRGLGADCPFPGSGRGYRARHTDCGQDVLARMELFAATSPGRCGCARVLNVGDGEVVTFEDVWGGICEELGLRGRPPPTGGGETVRQFVERHGHRWPAVAEREGLTSVDAMASTDWRFVGGVLQIPFDRHLDLTSSREVGFQESVDPLQGYRLCFDRMRRTRLIHRH